jgi:hypothetical protein
MFKYEKPFFVNWESGKVLDVEGNKDVEAQPVIINKRHGGANQRWRVVYEDEAAKTETKGLNEEFGFHIKRDFYMISELPFNRVAECLGHNNILLRKW